MRRFILPLLAALALTAAALFTAPAEEAGHDGHGGAAALAVGDLDIASAWARAMLPGQTVGAGYLSVTNNSAHADRLVGAASPVSPEVELHRMEVVDDVMTMRPVEGGLPIPAGETVALTPGGLHLMFMDVAEPFAEGERVPVTLEFEQAGPVELELPVRRTAAGDAAHDH